MAMLVRKKEKTKKQEQLKTLMISEMCEWEAAAADDDDLKTATINSKYQSFVGAR